MEHLCDPAFAPLLAEEFDLDELNADQSNIVGLWRDHRIAYVNGAWQEFARENGGGGASPLGESYFAPIPPVLVAYYRDLFGRATMRSALSPASHRYECSAADVFREFAMMVYALTDARGFVVVHTKLKEGPHSSRTPMPARAEAYRDSTGILQQCCHCRRTQRNDTAEWDWVPEWVAETPKHTSHTVCSVCELYYYGAG